MAHTVSVCTPTPFAQVCYNVDSDKNKYVSFHVNDSILHYTYIPQFDTNGCNTVRTHDKIITTCPDTITTIHLPSINDMQNQLDIIDNLLKNTQHNANQCMKKMDFITGVSSGDVIASTNMPDVNINVNNMIPQINKINYDTLINAQVCNTDVEIKCKSCGNVWIKEYLLKNELYWCQMCSIGHVFAPFTIYDFAPFESLEKLKSFEEQLLKQHNDVYNSHKGYWVN